MIKTNVLISSDGVETGTLLVSYLYDRGVFDVKGPAVVCYGLSSNASPSLNGACKSDKITRMKRMQAAGVQLVPWAVGADAANLPFPLYARKMRGYGAKDLMPVFQPEEVPWRIAAGWDWFSSILQIQSEMRLWVWRGELLDTVEKVMNRPEAYKGMGRNFGQGFEFRYREKEYFPATHQAVEAVTALGLDFGAVDLIVDPDGEPWVLEVNTAPGVIRSGMQRTLATLADRIAEWCGDDCPDWPGHINRVVAEAVSRQERIARNR